jgi:hypothetical protein
METINIKNNRRILAVIATFLLFSLFANVYYYQTGKDILAQSTSREGIAVYANEFSNIEQVTVEEIDATQKQISKEEIEFNRKVSKIKKYLEGRGAPLAKYSEEFVKAADHYGIDYRIVAAISVIESNGGRHTFKAYNAWGWSKTSFENWTDGIWTVSAGISKYYSNGLTRPELIAPYYCPPNAVKWAQNVNYVMNQIGD